MKILDIPRSGSVAATTSSHNRAGQYVRNRRTPTNAPSPRRTTIRTALGSQSSRWSSLTDAQRNAWQAAADAHPITDSLGQSIKLTGHQLFVALNLQLLNNSATVIDVPPADFSVFSVAGTTGTFSLATGVNFVVTTTGTSDDFIDVALSKPLPAGRNFWKTFRQQAAYAGDTATITITTANYTAMFGTPVVGQKVFAKLTPVSQHGVTGVPLTIILTVTA